jgi:PIN domain nuclease of toxin-antitoxin system
MIVATARVCKYPLLTADQKILEYPDVQNLQ